MTTPTTDVAPDKEKNFRALEAQKNQEIKAYQEQLAQERHARQEAERLVQEALQRKRDDDDEDDNEPYVNPKKLTKTLNKFGEQTKKETQTEIQKAVQQALKEEKERRFLEDHPDFYEVLEQHAEKLMTVAPRLAQRILELPQGPERSKLVYENIKTLGLDKPAQKQSTIQEKIDQNRRSPYYQPTGIGAAPYASVGDFSDTGQKNAYDKMQELKRNLRI
jgi:hypothetical protein